MLVLVRCLGWFATRFIPINNLAVFENLNVEGKTYVLNSSPYKMISDFLKNAALQNVTRQS